MSDLAFEWRAVEFGSVLHGSDWRLYGELQYSPAHAGYLIGLAYRSDGFRTIRG